MFAVVRLEVEQKRQSDQTKFRADPWQSVQIASSSVVEARHSEEVSRMPATQWLIPPKPAVQDRSSSTRNMRPNTETENDNHHSQAPPKHHHHHPNTPRGEGGWGEGCNHGVEKSHRVSHRRGGSRLSIIIFAGLWQ
ncbi:hypothetical protein ZHAS_00002647 [Anopheles sinensis]|uniref:Uncharacterized protein n=1 Tax=Anopheles sinensis TaxID=74873 RepID=A0A084VCQ1_ANOSI|nr:hypothetical protein ZHAS_00002647 [Anopheles sinensis]